jgi:hypothetical protein
MPRPRKLTAAQELEIVEWYQSLKSVKQKAREYGIHPGTLRSALARHGMYVGTTHARKKQQIWRRFVMSRA